ncbi:MAG: FAD-linked oxidase C-terminal domain-containing protein [Breznakibacter sp.]
MSTRKITASGYINELRHSLEGDVLDDMATRHIYSTDASAYQEMPVAVVLPKNEADIAKLIHLANKHRLPLIPRGAGTSLAGQVVGNGTVVDVSRYMNRILEVNVPERWVEVEPGVVLDELNVYLRSYGLFFGPETSTSNRCTIGGMVGNNSCGSRLLVYGSTRDHLLQVSGFLANADHVSFMALDEVRYYSKLRSDTFEGQIYNSIHRILSDKENRVEIEREFPRPDIKRRNTGYAIDLLARTMPFENGGEPYNLCKLIAGSEGTLMFVTRIRLNLLPLPSPHYGLLCAHFGSLDEALSANLIALGHGPTAVELMDKTVLDLTKGNIVQRKNRFFIDGDPAALLLVEFNAESDTAIDLMVQHLVEEFRTKGLGYAYPLLKGGEIGKVWALRKAGLGVLSNMPGDDFPVPVIEDTAVHPGEMAGYLVDIGQMLAKHGKSCVYYGHVGTGELHLRPILNMKRPGDVVLFRTIAEETAGIVKKYKGSLSGEHGDGRLRGEFIPLMIGPKNYQFLKEIKRTFDPNGIFNPGKITDTPPMDTHMRYNASVNNLVTAAFRWPVSGGLVQGADKCNGSADCRKSQIIGGGMCPSFMATRNEEHTTRARANMLRLFLSRGLDGGTRSLDEVKHVLDLCLMCKACKAECPSNIDLARLKMEFLNHYRQKQGLSLRDKLFAYQPRIMAFASYFPRIANAVIRSNWFRLFMAATVKTHRNAIFPKVAEKTFRKLAVEDPQWNGSPKRVWLFVDEFTNLHEPELGIATIRLFERLGYAVRLAPNVESGRTYMSKGLLDNAKKLAERNVSILSRLITSDVPLVGIEPSAILSFRDEYPDLVGNALAGEAWGLAGSVFTVEEFLWREIERGAILRSQFTNRHREVLFHVHCAQKVLSDASITQKLLSFPENYTAKEIKSGCCGMAGSFGYEAEHAVLAIQIGEMALFPAVRNSASSVVVAASGTSCRHHIGQHTHRVAEHPVMVLFDALL